MNVNCWDKCFLCLTNFGSTSSSSSSCGGKKTRGRQKQTEITEKPNLSALIKYLLGSWDQSENDSLLQRIRRLQLQRQASSTSSSEGLIKFCEKCQDSARRISHLQMELEVIQMKIVDILGQLRKTVIGNSNGHRDGTSGLSLEELTEEREEVLDTIQAFQAAVIEKCKESFHVPLVYIEKFTGCNLKTSRAILTPTAEENEHFNLIKTEPEADSLDVILSNFFDGHVSFDYDHPATPNEGDDTQEERMDTNNDVNMTPMTPDQVPLAYPPRELEKQPIMSKKAKLRKKSGKEKSPRKRGRPRKNPPVQEIKEEQAEFLSVSNSEPDGILNPIIKEENFVDGPRKSRSAAQTAAKRIADVKKLSRASFQFRPIKVANRAKKTEQVKTRESKEVKTKGNSTRASSFKTPKQGGKKSTPKKAAPRIREHFRCEICPYKTVNNFQFEHHLTQHESPEVVNQICPHCTNPPRQFLHKQSFDFHMNSHSGLNKMICDLCPKFLDHFSILEHLRGHPEAEKIFQCSCCSYYCGTREAYLRHIRYHGVAALVCDVCSKKFRTRQRMLHHMHEEHNLLKKTKCDVANCDKEFFETHTMRIHKRRHLEPFVCLECNLQFPAAGYLFRHQVRVHSRQKPFRCSECSEGFLDKVSLQTHAIKAHGAANVKCPYCPKEFTSQGSLNSHIPLHDGISFPCDQCDKVFGDRRHLKRHQEVHNPTKDFVCEECGKAFQRREKLRIHRKIHIGDKRYKCSYCPKAFVGRGNCIVHERIHTGEKPYVCEACGKDFNQRGPFNQHMRTQHNK